MADIIVDNTQEQINLPFAKTYVARLSQLNADDPTAVVMQNNIGDIVWTRSVDGFYSGFLENAFPLNKTICFIGANQSPDTFIRARASGGSEVTIETRLIVDQSYSDGVLTDTPIEIRVYP